MPPVAVVEQLAETLAIAAAEDFASNALRQAVARHVGETDRQALARAFVVAIGGFDARDLDAGETPINLATLGILLCGKDAFIAALAWSAAAPASPLDPVMSLTLADAAGLDGGPAMPEVPPQVAAPLVAGLADVGTDEQRLYGVAADVLTMPIMVRAPLVRALLASKAPDADKLRLAAILALAGPDLGSTKVLLTWLRQGTGEAAAWLAAALAGPRARGRIPAELPPAWPLVRAFASFPDGAGSQGLYVVRRRPDGDLALASAVVNEWRGLADAAGQPRMTEREERDLLATLAAGAAVVPVDAEHVGARLAEGLAASERLGLPLPFQYRLFRGLQPEGPGSGAPWPSVVTWARPELLARTNALLDAPGLESWYFEPEEAPAHAAFFEAAAASGLRDLGSWLPAFFDEATRGRWAARLAEAAYLFDRTGARETRDHAATAAVALRPGSGVSLAEQPFAREVLARSARYHRERQGSDGDDDFIAMLDTLSAAMLATRERAKKPAAPRKAASALAREGDVYQLKIALKGARPPIWRRVLVPADLSLSRLHDVIQAAMGWEDYHLHAFRVGGREFAPRGSGLGARDEAKVRLNELVGPGGKLDYEYDFGDGWEHTITVEQALPREDGGIYPRCIKGKGACPPEDSGGLYGYYDKLAIAGDPDDDEHEDVLAWLGGDFAPDAFDLAAAAARVAAVALEARKRKR